MPTALPRLALVVFAVAACGKGADRNPRAGEPGTEAGVAAPLSLPALGVDRLGRFNFIYDSGRPAYDKAEAAGKKQDWAEVRRQTEAAIARDVHHYDAHRLLAVALAQTGEHAAAVDHLVTALAADFHGYASAYASDPLLAGFRASPHGQAVSQLVARIRQELDRKVTSGLWFVGRRSPFRYEKPTGVQPATSRGELYAFDRETRRYVRLTHTGHQVAGFVRSRGGNEVAVLGFDRVDRPADDAPALIARAWVRTFETTTWTPSSERVTFGPARAIAAHYAEGDQLLVGAAPAADRWTLGTWTVSSLDRSGGALTKVTTPLGAPRIELTLEQGRRITTGGDAVKATWTGEPARAPELSFGSTTIVVPESGLAAQESVALAPDGAYLAFSTAVDPCATDTAPSLYVAHGKTGALKHLLTSNSRFATRWLDATTLAYEDGDGALRLWDSTTGREAMRLENKPGVALEVLSMASAPLCTQAPPAAEPPAAGGSADEMPPEEPAGGPTAAPQ